ncbi:MAG: sulfate adenylyltransferase subunit CysD [Thiohalomonadales bacterium]
MTFSAENFEVVATPSEQTRGVLPDIAGQFRLTHLQQLESEAIHIMREVIAEFSNPVMLYSVGKDSSVLLRLAQKAFFPGRLPFPLLHVDTGYKFPEMIVFRDEIVQSIGARLIVRRNEDAINTQTHPNRHGVARCCAALKTTALLRSLAEHGFDSAFGGARRDEEKSRAKERIFSFRDKYGQWDPKNQRPELWRIYNGRIHEGESVRVFPLSNWSELDIWQYIKQEQIPIVPLYFAKPRLMIERGNLLIPADRHSVLNAGETATPVMSRFRTLGCSPCTGAIRSDATTVDAIIAEMKVVKRSERETRLIDHGASSMEDKKREGYF